MIPIPAYIKKVFDAFPLQTYPAVPTKKVDEERYFFSGNTSAHSFTLAVHNIVPIGDQLVPSDPVSLGQALILAHKNNLKLPSNTSKDASDASPHSILKTSLYAAPNNQLPMLIEDLGEARNIRTSSLINQSVAAKNFTDPELVLINDLIDTRLYDLWILALLSENLGPHQLSNILGTNADIPVDKLTILDTFNEIPFWNSFKLRHPSLFDNVYDSTIVLSTQQDRIKAYYAIELSNFQTTFDLIIDLVSNRSTPEIELLRLKVAAYFVIVDSLLPNTQFGTIIKLYPDMISESYKVLAQH